MDARELPDEYSPDSIHLDLVHWPELQAAAEGGTGSLNGRGAGRGERLGLITRIADLEQAADQLPLYWSGTLEVFRMQRRQREWGRRRLVLEDVSFDAALAHMARSLGWRPPAG